MYDVKYPLVKESIVTSGHKECRRFTGTRASKDGFGHVIVGPNKNG